MAEALATAHEHIVAIQQLQAGAMVAAEGFDESVMEKIKEEQASWEREMDRYRAASKTLMERNDVHWD